MKRLIYIFITLLCFETAVSCSDFLDVIPTGVVIPNTVEHFDQMLNGVMVSGIGQTDLQMDPDIYQTSTGSYYLWEEIQMTGATTDTYYMAHYKNIYTANIILENVDKAPLGGANEATRILVKRDALCERAINYFRLVNMYSPAYSERNAGKVSVPLALTADSEALTPSSTVGEVYEQILADLHEALDMVKDNEPASFCARGSNLGVKALLAKTYLYMGNFTEALKYTNAALADYSVLNDYNSYASSAEYPAYHYKDKEVIWYRGGICSGFFFGVNFGKELSALFDKENDLRFLFFATESKELPEGMYAHTEEREMNPICGVPDLFLMRAECNAVAGNLNEAMKDLDLLRKNRIKAEAFAPYYPSNMPANKDQALELIANERRRETAMSGENIWVQKRYHEQGRPVPTFKRVDKDGVVLATLEPGSTGYWIGFAASLMKNNPNIKWNK